MKYFAYNLYPIAALVFAAYCLSINHEGWTIIGVIISVISAVVPKTSKDED